MVLLIVIGSMINSTLDFKSYGNLLRAFFGLLEISEIGGHAKTLMFAHVSPEEDSFGETVSTLKFAQRVSSVELGAARSNRESSEVMQLKEQVRVHLLKCLSSFSENYY